MADKIRRVRGEPETLDVALLSFWRAMGLSAAERTEALEDFEADRAKPASNRAKDDDYQVPVGPSRRRSGRPRAKP